MRERGAPPVDVRGTGSLLVDDRTADPEGACAHLCGPLPGGLRLLVVEGYRPPALQERYVADHRDGLRRTPPARPWT